MQLRLYLSIKWFIETGFWFSQEKKVILYYSPELFTLKYSHLVLQESTIFSPKLHNLTFFPFFQIVCVIKELYKCLNSLTTQW